MIIIMIIIIIIIIIMIIIIKPKKEMFCEKRLHGKFMMDVSEMAGGTGYGRGLKLGIWQRAWRGRFLQLRSRPYECGSFHTTIE